MLKRLVYIFAGIALLLSGLPSAGVSAPAAPQEDPVLVLTGATDYVIQDPKIFYLNNPGCSPIASASDASSSTTPDDIPATREGAPQLPEANVTQRIGRTSVSGITPREMYRFTFDEFCSPPDTPDIISDIASDDMYVYYVSQEYGGLARISEDRFYWMTTVLPEVIYSHTPRASELVLVGDYIYMLQTGFGTTGLYRVNKSTGASTQLLNGAQVGTNPNDFQTDGQYLYWRFWTGSQWNLEAYDLGAGTHDTIGLDMFSYYPVSGNVVYIGYEDVIRGYDLSTSSLSSPLYTSAVNAYITAVNADGSALYFIENPVGVPGAYTLYRKTFGGSAVPLYAPPATPPYQTMYKLQRQGSYLFFLHGDQLKRIRTNADIAPLTNLRIDGIEITQAIQDDSNSVQLIRAKRTAVRLFASSDGAEIPGVYARLYRVNGSGTVIDGPLWPTNLARDSAFMRVPASPDRDDINQSFTFFLPPNWVDDPTLRIRAELNPFRFPPEPNYSDNTLTTATYNMEISRRLETHFVLFEYESGGVNYRPRYREDFLQAISWIRRAYPLASSPGWSTDATPGFRPAYRYIFDEALGGNVDGTDRDPDCQRRIDLDPGEDGHIDDPDFCAAWYVVCPTLDTIRAAEGLPEAIFQVGMVADDAGFPRGWACGLGVSTPSGSGTWGWDNDGSYADWYAGHEIGHSQGRGHTFGDPSYPWPDQEIGDNTFRGFDLGDSGLNSLLVPRVYPNEWHDVMSYESNQWISAYTYNGIRTFGSLAAATEAVQAGPFLQLSGVLFPAAQEAEIPQARLWADLSFQPNPPTPGDYRIRLLNGSGTQIAFYDFTPDPGPTDAVMYVSEYVPFDANTARIEITHPGSGALLWSYDLSANAPTVDSVQLNIAQESTSAVQTLQWTASDPDGDSLTYDVLYSDDNGLNWQMLHMGLTGTSAQIDTDELPGSQQGRFKVIASDGMRQGELVSTAYPIAMKPPVIDVLTPADGQTFVFGSEVLFSAEVYDLQDGSISPGSIQWRDQTNFLLGTGTQFSQDNLLIGANIITITATNSDGLQATKTFTFYIDDELQPPAPTLTVGPDQVGWHVDEGETTPQTADVSVANMGEGEFNLSISEDAPWLSVSQSGGTTPLAVTLSADPTLIKPGNTFTTTLQIQGTINNDTQMVEVPVSFSMGLITSPFPPVGGTIYLPYVER